MQIVGGWKASLISRYHSGTPATISAGGAYPTNYELSALVNLLPGATNNYGSYIDNNGVPEYVRQHIGLSATTSSSPVARWEHGPS